MTVEAGKSALDCGGASSSSGRRLSALSLSPARAEGCSTAVELELREPLSTSGWSLSLSPPLPRRTRARAHTHTHTHTHTAPPKHKQRGREDRELSRTQKLCSPLIDPRTLVQPDSPWLPVLSPTAPPSPQPHWTRAEAAPPGTPTASALRLFRPPTGFSGC